MKINNSYTEGIAKLEVNGLPDHSLGHDTNTIGIILNWRCTLVGHSILEGKKEHLSNLIYAINLYSRYCITGNHSNVSDKTNSVFISKHKDGHELTFISSKKEIEPLSIILDDAEISDFILCIDQFVVDKRVKIEWIIHDKIKFSSKRKIIGKKIKINLINLFTAFALILGFSLIYMKIPMPILEETQEEQKPFSQRTSSNN